MNPVERLAAAAHVGYELRQMAGAAIRIDNAPDEATHDSHLESTLLHARNLIEFLIGAQIGRGRTTDVRAQVFVRLPAAWDVRPATDEVWTARGPS